VQWLENRYAGCACDIPSVGYQFPWRAHIWSKYYSPGPEIWDYLKMVERENKFIDKYVKLRHQIISAEWTDGDAKWKVTVEDLESGEVKEEVVDVLLNGGGILK
jgi:cation diffusion facilitator CzcD-associated flavoprotein CzcO